MEVLVRLARSSGTQQRLQNCSISELTSTLVGTESVAADFIAQMLLFEQTCAALASAAERRWHHIAIGRPQSFLHSLPRSFGHPVARCQAVELPESLVEVDRWSSQPAAKNSRVSLVGQLQLLHLSHRPVGCRLATRVHVQPQSADRKG
jgi:hypothetical protein